MSDQEVQEVDYQAVRRRVVRRFIKLLLFAVDVLLWLGYFAASAPYYPSGAVANIFVWFLLLIVHFVYAFEIWSRTVDRMTQHEIESLQRKGYRVTPPIYPPSRKVVQSAKQKRDQVARLSDDGEIVYEENEDQGAPRVTGRRSK